MVFTLLITGFFAFVATYFGLRILKKSYDALGRQASRLVADRKPIVDVEPNDGTVVVTGTVQPSGESVAAAFAEDDAVLVETHVDYQYTSSGGPQGTPGGRQKKWSLAARTVDAVPFVVADETGRALIDPPADPEVELESSERTYRVGEGREPPPRVRTFLDGSDAVEADPERTRRYRQQALSPGTEVSVQAVADDRPHEHDAGIQLTGDSDDVLVSDLSQETLETRERRKVLLGFPVGVGVLLLGLASAAVFLTRITTVVDFLPL